MTEEEKLKKDLEKILNTDGRIHGEAMRIILDMQKKYSNIEIMAIGILTSKLVRQKTGGKK